jgi:hypothetical protein
MYYLLECFGPPDRERAAIDTVPRGLYWNRGRRFEQPVSEPLEVILDGDGLMMPMFNRGILLFSDELVEAVRDAGVDNIDCYDAVLVDPVGGKRHTNYKAVNIIGMVAAADLAASEFHAPSGRALIDTDFDTLVLDEERANGLLLFRLAESVNAIVVHARVKQHLEKRGIPNLDFVAPDAWVG